MTDDPLTYSCTKSSFSADQYAQCYPPGIEGGYWTLARNWMIADAMEQARRSGWWSGRGSILEVGCGPGIVVQFLRGQGYDAWGAEVASPEARPSALPYLYLGQDCTTLDLAFREQVTAILLLDVIEHLAEPEPFLARLARAFPYCHLFLVTVPARQEIWSNYDVHYGHHRRYDHKSLAKTLRAAGLEPDQPRYFFRVLYVVALILALLRCPRPVALKTPWPVWAHRLLASIFYGLEKVLVPLPTVPGSSVMSLARVLHRS